jgi:hypothetical protein
MTQVAGEVAYKALHPASRDSSLGQEGPRNPNPRELGEHGSLGDNGRLAKSLLTPQALSREDISAWNLDICSLRIADRPGNTASPSAMRQWSETRPKNRAVLGSVSQSMRYFSIAVHRQARVARLKPRICEFTCPSYRGKLSMLYRNASPSSSRCVCWLGR